MVPGVLLCRLDEEASSSGKSRPLQGHHSFRSARGCREEGPEGRFARFHSHDIVQNLEGVPLSVYPIPADNFAADDRTGVCSFEVRVHVVSVLLGSGGVEGGVETERDVRKAVTVEILLACRDVGGPGDGEGEDGGVDQVQGGYTAQQLEEGGQGHVLL